MKKRIVAGMMAILMALGTLTGCGSAQASAADGASGSSAQRTVEDIREAGVLKVGAKSDTLNIGMIDTSTGEYKGYEIDLAYEIAASIFDCTAEEAKKNGLVEFTSVTAKTRGGLLDNGELDCVIAAFTITEERKKSWDFTQQYRLEPVTFLVRKDSGATTLADMDGFIIGVGQGTTTADLIKEYAAEKNIDANYEIQDFQYIFLMKFFKFRHSKCVIAGSSCRHIFQFFLWSYAYFQFSDRNRHMKGAEIVYRCFYSQLCCLYRIFLSDIPYTPGIFCKPLRFLHINILRPGFPHCRKAGSVGYIIFCAELMADLMRTEILLSSKTCNTIMGKAAAPH